MKDFKVNFWTVYQTLHPVSMTRAERDATYLPYIKVFINNIKITEPVDVSKINTFGGLCQVLNNITTKENLIKYIQSHNNIHGKSGGRGYVTLDTGSFRTGIIFLLDTDNNTSMLIDDLYSVYRRTFNGPELFNEVKKRYATLAQKQNQASK